MIYYWAFEGNKKKAEGTCHTEEEIKRISENASLKGWHVNFIQNGKLIASA